MISGINSFSTASLSEMRQKMFNQIDTNGDGSIDKTEMSAMIQQNTTTLVDDIFGKVDTDQNGLISQIESDSGLAKLGQETKKDGGIWGVSGRPHHPPPPEKVFDAADTNKDGVVSKEELSAIMGQNGGNIDDLFSKVDTDSDGLISRAEDETFRKQMTEGMQQKETANSGTNDIGNFTQSWQSGMFNTLLQSLTASASTSGESTSLYA